MALPGKREDLQVSISYDDWWAPEPVWILEKNFFFAPAGDRIPIPGLRSQRLKSKIFRFREDRLN